METMLAAGVDAGTNFARLQLWHWNHLDTTNATGALKMVDTNEARQGLAYVRMAKWTPSGTRVIRQTIGTAKLTQHLVGESSCHGGIWLRRVEQSS